MEVQNLNQTKPNRTKVNRQAHKLQTTQTNRHRDVLLLSYLHSPYLPTFVPIYAAYCSHISTQRPLRTYTSPYLPPPYLGA